MRPSIAPVLEGNKIKLYNYRFVNISLYFMLNVAMSCVWASIALVQTELQDVYGVQATQALLLTNIFYFLYIPGTLLSAVMFTKFGFRTTTAIGGCMMTLATLSRALGGLGPSFAAQIIGALVGGFAQPMILNGCSLLSITWFAVHERNAATTLGETVPAALGGAILGQLMGKYNVATPGQLSWYFWSICMLAGATTLSFIIFYRAKPPSPPSFPRAEKQTQSSILDPLKLFLDPYYSVLVFIIGADYSFICTFPTFLTNIYTIVGSQSETLSDNAISFFLFGGILGAIIAGFGVDYLKQRDARFFQWTIMAMNACVVVFMLLFLLACKPNNGIAMQWLIAAVSFFATGVIPVGIEAAAEITFPAPEGSSAGFLIMAGNLIAAITIEATTTNGFPTATLWSTFGLSVVALLASFTFRPKYKRTLFEQSEKAHGGVAMHSSLDTPLLDN